MKLIADYFRNYVNFSGRTTRRDYWLTVLYLFLVTLPIVIILEIKVFGAFKMVVNSGMDIQKDPLALFSCLYSSPIIIILTAIFWLWNIVRFIPDLSMTARRLRDAGVTPWWVVIPYATIILPVIGGFLCLGSCIIILILLCQPSKQDEDSPETTNSETTTK